MKIERIFENVSGPFFYINVCGQGYVVNQYSSRYREEFLNEIFHSRNDRISQFHLFKQKNGFLCLFHDYVFRIRDVIDVALYTPHYTHDDDNQILLAVDKDQNVSFSLFSFYENDPKTKVQFKILGEVHISSLPFYTTSGTPISASLITYNITEIGNYYYFGNNQIQIESFIKLHPSQKQLSIIRFNTKDFNIFTYDVKSYVKHLLFTRDSNYLLFQNGILYLPTFTFYNLSAIPDFTTNTLFLGRNIPHIFKERDFNGETIGYRIFLQEYTLNPNEANLTSLTNVFTSQLPIVVQCSNGIEIIFVTLSVSELMKESCSTIFALPPNLQTRFANCTDDTVEETNNQTIDCMFVLDSNLRLIAKLWETSYVEKLSSHAFGIARASINNLGNEYSNILLASPDDVLILNSLKGKYGNYLFLPLSTGIYDYSSEKIFDYSFSKYEPVISGVEPYLKIICTNSDFGNEEFLFLNMRSHKVKTLDEMIQDEIKKEL